MRAILITIIILLSGCSWIFKKSPELASKLTLDLYMKRASLNQVNFEQYKIVRDNLVYECGVINNDKHFIKKQRMIELLIGAKKDIFDSVTEILKLNSKGKLNLETPGTGANIFDPGVFVLFVSDEEEKEKIETGFDSILKNTSDRNFRELRRLASKLQAIVKDDTGECSEELRLQERVVERPGFFQRALGWVGF